MEHGEKTMSSSPDIAVESCPRHGGLRVATLPARFGQAQFGVNGGAFFRGRLRVG
jgi:hypothetical protein